MAEKTFQHTFPNGLTLLAERLDHVRSAAFNFLVPAGSAYEADADQGTASLLSDLITRGAGERSSKELALALDGLGLDRSESAGTFHMRFWASTLARNLLPALEIYADILRRPLLDEEELEPVKLLALQDLQALEDDPKQKVMIELKKHHLPTPLGRDRRGTLQTLEKITMADVRRHFQKFFQPRGTIVSVAGNIEWNALRDTIGRLFGDWPASQEPTFSLGQTGVKREHLHKETEQTQIALAYDSVPITHPDYYVAMGAVNVLSGGMSSRLFTEVREKRGLCYSVWASYSSFKDRAFIVGYAGSTNERAQETLDVTLQEFRRLADGIEEDEVQRVQAGLKSSLIMQEESTSARAGAIAGDWYYLGRIRTLDEIQAAIDSLTPARLIEHLKAHPPKDITLVTLGPKPLRME